MPLSASYRSALVLAVLLAGAAVPAAGQGLRSELKLGVTSTTMRGETVVDFENRQRLAAAVGFGYDFGNGFAIQPEIVYVPKGAVARTTMTELQRLLGNDTDPEPDPTGVRIEFNMSYLEFPVLAYYRLETNSRFHPRIFAGPSVALKLDAQTTFSVDGSDLEFTEEDDTVQNLDYGLVLGGGLEVDAGFERVTLDLRATLGQSNAREREPAIKHTAFILTLGVVL